MENKFKYRPEIKSIEDLRPGDEFLVGDERWRFSKQVRDPDDVSITGMFFHNHYVTQDLIRANVPIERDIPYPEGGAEGWELVDGNEPRFITYGCLCWDEGEWVPVVSSVLGRVCALGFITAIPKWTKPAPKEYTVRNNDWVDLGDDPTDSNGNRLEPGDRVTVQRVSEQGEPR
jgi:hypothetical protein